MSRTCYHVHSLTVADGSIVKTERDQDPLQHWHLKNHCNGCHNNYLKGPWHVGHTGSRQITEVKQRWARLVLGWVTVWVQAGCC